MRAHGGGFSIANSRQISDLSFADKVAEFAAQDLLATQPGLRSDVGLPGVAGKEGKVVQPERAEIAGFRHFLDSRITPAKKFRIEGGEERLRRLMSGLAALMHRRHEWEPHPEGKGSHQAWENPNIPAGYTYLLQLVAHDLVHTSMPVSILEDTTTGVRNDRAYGLKLDTIYGGGPLVCPHAFARDANGETRSNLRLGRMRNGDGSQPANGPFRDIARLICDDFTVNGSGRTEAMVADPRNDAHAILAQLTALFHHLHNGLIELLGPPTVGGMMDSELEATFDRFLCARGAASLIYRNVVRHDLLEKILEERIHKEYSGDAPRFISERFDSPPHDGTKGHGQSRPSPVPLEFTHGAFRFGHAMVRDKYRLNDIEQDFSVVEALYATSGRLPAAMPLDHNWMIRWSYFFKTGPIEPNASRRIGPHLAQGLREDRLFGEIDATGRVGLAYRDLMSAAFAGLWSVNSLIEEIRRERPDLIEQSELLRSSKTRVDELTKWLARAPQSTKFTAEDIETLANEPPLPFFVLFEAEWEKKGMRLGTLGSIIVAEVIFGAMCNDPLPADKQRASLLERMKKLSGKIRAAQHLEAVPEIKTMAQLIEFTAEISHLRDVKPAFF